MFLLRRADFISFLVLFVGSISLLPQAVMANEWDAFSKNVASTLRAVSASTESWEKFYIRKNAKAYPLVFMRGIEQPAKVNKDSYHQLMCDTQTSIDVYEKRGGRQVTYTIGVCDYADPVDKDFIETQKSYTKEVIEKLNREQPIVKDNKQHSKMYDIKTTKLSNGDQFDVFHSVIFSSLGYLPLYQTAVLTKNDDQKVILVQSSLKLGKTFCRKNRPDIPRLERVCEEPEKMMQDFITKIDAANDW